MSSTQIHRHDRGAKVAGRKMGGKFAAHRRAAATFPGSEIPDGGTLTLQEDFKAITERAHQILRARGISDPDQRNDMVQDVAMDLWQQALKGKADLSTEHRGMVSTVASRKAAQFFNNGERHEDHRARTMLDEKANAQEQALGRKLTRSERQELVDEITRSFPAGGRPSRGGRTESASPSSCRRTRQTSTRSVFHISPSSQSRTSTRPTARRWMHVSTVTPTPAHSSAWTVSVCAK